MSHNVLLKTWQALKQSVIFKVMDGVCIVSVYGVVRVLHGHIVNWNFK